MLLMRSSYFPGRKVTSWAVPFWTSAKLASDSYQSRYLCARTEIQSYRQLAMIRCRRVERMKRKLKTKAGAAVYARRKCMVDRCSGRSSRHADSGSFYYEGCTKYEGNGL